MGDPAPPPGDELRRLDERLARLERAVADLAAAREPRGVDLPRWKPSAAADARPVPPPQPSPGPSLDIEQWIGAKGLLLVGVLALLASAGFLLKYAFDHGWIAPWVRVVGAVVIGAAVAGFGEREVALERRRFGLAMVGAGGGLAYLGLWAAGGPYALIPGSMAVLLVAGVTALVAWRALHHGAQPLALWALLGALSAPLFLPDPNARPETFLAYLGVVGGAGMLLAWAYSWRGTMALAVFGTLVFPAILTPEVFGRPLGQLYLAAVAVYALAAIGERHWGESRLVAPLVAWVTLATHAGSGAATAAGWGGLAAAALLLAGTWRHQWRVPSLLRVEMRPEDDDHSFLSLLTPFLFVLVAVRGTPPLLLPVPGLVPLLAGLVSAAFGWREHRASWIFAAFIFLMLAAAVQFTDAPVVVLWCGLILMAILVDVRFDQRGGAAAAVPLAGIAMAGLVMGLTRGLDGEPALRGPWSYALYGYVAATAFAAAFWRARPELPLWLRNGAAWLWAAAAVAIFAGGSLELDRLFAGSRLAAGLAISVFWLLYAGAAVWIGFRVRRRLVRGVGLAVAGLAAQKIVLVDLSSLEALWRVGSFFALALIALAVAWGYNRARQTAGPPAS